MSKEKITKISEIINSIKLYCQLKDKRIAKSMELSCSELNCLKQFFDNKNLSVKELSKKLNITPGGVTRIVAVLESRGILRRDMDKNDRRGINVSMTKSGQDLVGQLRINTLNYCIDLLDGVDEKDQTAIYEGLVILYKIWMTKLESQKERFDSELSGNDNC